MLTFKSRGQDGRGCGMTSEIAVMNQRAVALAADSAVTLIAGGQVVIRNDQRKLYNLLEGKPVGLMFFGVADIMGHPWEHLIEHYQKKVRPGSLKHLRDYAAGFTGMMDNLKEFFPPDKQKDEYRKLLASVFRYIFGLAQFMKDSAQGEGGQRHGGAESRDRARLARLSIQGRRQPARRSCLFSARLRATCGAGLAVRRPMS